jgi:hypothetical protein
MDDAYLTVAEIGAKFRLTPRAVHARVKARRWPCWGEGRSARFSPEQVAYIEALEAHGPEPAPTPVDLTVAMEGIRKLNRAHSAR